MTVDLSEPGVVRRIGQYRPFEGGGATAREAQEDLVLGSLAEHGGLCGSLDECQADIEALFGIRLDRMEVARAIRDLERTDRVTTSGRIELSQSEKARLDAVAAESARDEANAISQWERMVKDRWPGLEEATLEALRDQLDIYLRTVFRRHGAESALILYPDDSRAAAIFQKLEDEGFEFLPPAPGGLDDVRIAAFSEFVRSPTPEQQLYLGRMLNTAHFMTLLSIDPDAAELVKELAAGQRVYLDTNFLFRLLGIQGPGFMLPARTVLARTQDAGYECVITPWTVEEFQRALRRSEEYLARYPVPPSEYAALAAESASEEDFVTAYWRKVKDEPGLKPEDFIALYSELEPHLAAVGIAIVDEGCRAIEDREGEVEEDMAIMDRALMSGHGRPRGDTRLKHDARHRRLILRLRGSGNRSFANAGYWFLTHDSLLPRYDFMARGARSPEPPFCVSVGAWFQVVEAFRPKTDDAERSLADLLASPYVRYRRSLSKESAQAVAARLALHKDITPELAATLFMNSFLMREVEDTADPEAKIEKIDNAIIEAAKQAQREAEAALDYAEEVRADAARTKAEAEKRTEEERRERDRAIAAAEAARDHAVKLEADRRERAIQSERDDSEERIRRLTESHETRLAERDRQIETQGQDLATIKRFAKVGAIALILAVVFVGTAVVIGMNEAWVLIVGTGVVIGLVAGIDQIVSRKK